MANVVHVDQEAGRLDDVGQRRAHLGQTLGEVGHGLRRLAGDATVDEAAVAHPELAGHEDEVAGANGRRVRTQRLALIRRPTVLVPRCLTPVPQPERVHAGMATRANPTRPGGGRHGGEDGVAAVHRFAVVVLDLDLDVAACRPRAGCRTSGS